MSCNFSFVFEIVGSLLTTLDDLPRSNSFEKLFNFSNDNGKGLNPLALYLAFASSTDPNKFYLLFLIFICLG